MALLNKITHGRWFGLSTCARPKETNSNGVTPAKVPYHQANIKLVAIKFLC